MLVRLTLLLVLTAHLCTSHSRPGVDLRHAGATARPLHRDPSGPCLPEINDDSGVAIVSQECVAIQPALHIASSPPPLSNPSLQRHRPFSFKGIGINFVKSVIHWETFGMNIIVPITPHFPEYDSVLHYPRVTCYFGVYYPCTLAATMSISLPSQVVLSSLQNLVGANGTTLGNGTGVGPWTPSLVGTDTSVQRVAVSDSVKRLGLRFSVRYDREQGLRGAVGPTIAYLPGEKVLELAKPVVLWVPTAVVCVLGTVMDTVEQAFRGMFQGLKQWLVGYRDKILQQLVPSVLAIGRNRTADYHHKKVSQRPRSPPLDRQQRWERTSAWLHSKTLGFATNLGYFASTNEDLAMGSNLIFELQPFFPFHKRLARLKKEQDIYPAEDS